jgi:hypothetical protein
MDEDKFRADAQRLYKAWSIGSGASGICGDTLRAVHRGEGTIDLGRLRVLDSQNWSAVAGMIALMRNSDIPMSGIRDVLDEAQFSALFADSGAEPSEPSGPSI